MKYESAKNILPEEVLKEVQKYAAGKLLYVPIENECKSWGEVSGYRQKLIKRNQMICNKYANGITISELADEYFLSLDSIKKIIYYKKDKLLEFSKGLSSAINYANVGMGEEWIQSYLMFCTDCKKENEFLLKEYIYFGIVKIPLRLIQLENEIVNSKVLIKMDGNTVKEIEPLIVRFEKDRFFVDIQKEILLALKERKVNAYPAFILTKDKDDHKRFMKNYGRHFICVDRL